MFTKTEVDERAPVVLVISEPDLLLTDLIKTVYRDIGYKVINLDLNENFFLTSQQFVQNSAYDLHKIVLLYGFKSCVKDYYSLVIELLSKLHAPLVLLSFLPTNISFLAKADVIAADFYQKRINFLTEIKIKRADSLLFIAQDLLLSGRFTSYPLLYFFNYLHEKQIVDLQNSVYFQDEKSLVQLLEPHLRKPHFAGSYLVRGKKQSTLKIAKEIGFLYEQYFQQHISFLKILTTTENTPFLREFAVITNTKANYVNLIDQKVRNVTDLIKAEQMQFSLEEMQQLAVRQQKETLIEAQQKKKAEKQSKKPVLMNFVGLFKKAEKQLVEPVVDEVLHEQLEKKVESLFSTQRQAEREVRQEKNVVTGQEIVKKTKKRKWLFWLGISFSILGLVFVVLITLFNASQEYLQKELFLAVKNDSNKVKNIDKSIIYSFFSFQYQYYQKILPVENLTTATDIQQLHDALLRLVATQENFATQGFELYQQTMKGGADLNYFYTTFEEALDQKIEAEKGMNAYLMGLNLELFSTEDRRIWETQIEETRRDLQASLKYKRFLAAFKEVALGEGRFTIAILLQDANELRGGGGILTEVLLLSLDKGVLVDRQLFSAEDLGARVYGKRTASDELRKMLGEDIFHLRDVSWSTDFEQTSQDLNWFLGQTLGQNADLVLGLHSGIVKQLSITFNGLKLRDGQEFFVEDYLSKLRDSALTDAQKDNQNTYSWQVAQLLLDQLFVLQRESFSTLFQSLGNALEKQEVQLFALNAHLNQVITANSWAGKQLEGNCPAEFNQEQCQQDFVLQQENNIGFNKVGEFIDRKVDHAIGITAEFIRHRRIISWENQSPSSLWPLGDYRFFMKLSLPKQVVIEKVQVGQKQFKEGEYSITETNSHKEIGLVLEVKPKTKLDVIVTYVSPNSHQKTFSYLFTDKKQAGGMRKTTNYTIVFADEIAPRLIAPVAQFENRTIRFINENENSFFFAIDFIDAQQAK